MSYPNGVKKELENELTPTQVKDQLSVQCNPEPYSYYTFCMTDIDLPNRLNPTGRKFQHWLVGIVPGGDINKGESFYAYVGPGPPPKSGISCSAMITHKVQCQIFSLEKPENNY
ncbi:phosphatidylethanolamine-binding protein homolog F40A3.3-like isoform X2 [Sipha flava]|nr:phosphatidylethanolamine-binding protein homolog F40A3.3-like isoform X2 [Sipha flava]